MSTAKGLLHRKGWAVLTKQQATTFVRHEWEAAPLGPHDVDIAVTHNGLCHSATEDGRGLSVPPTVSLTSVPLVFAVSRRSAGDLHMAENGWGLTEYPFVAGACTCV